MVEIVGTPRAARSRWCVLSRPHSRAENGLIRTEDDSTALAQARYSAGRSTLSQVLLTTTFENVAHSAFGSSHDTRLEETPNFESAVCSGVVSASNSSTSAAESADRLQQGIAIFIAACLRCYPTLSLPANGDSGSSSSSGDRPASDEGAGARRLMRAR